MNLEGKYFIDENNNKCIIVGYLRTISTKIFRNDFRLILYEETKNWKFLDDMVSDAIYGLYVLINGKVKNIHVDGMDEFLNTYNVRPLKNEEVTHILVKAKMLEKNICSYETLSHMILENLSDKVYKQGKNDCFGTFQKIWKYSTNGLQADVWIAKTVDGYCYCYRYNTANKITKSKVRKRRENDKKEFVRYLKFICTINNIEGKNYE